MPTNKYEENFDVLRTFLMITVRTWTNEFDQYRYMHNEVILIYEIEMHKQEFMYIPSFISGRVKAYKKTVNIINSVMTT